MKKEPSLKSQVTKKKKVMSTKRDITEKFEWSLVGETSGEAIDRLYKLYGEDKRSAKVLYKQSTSSYYKQSMMLYEHTNGDINIVLYMKKVGIGKSGVIYSSHNNTGSIIYIKKTNTFWLRSLGGKVLKQLSYETLTHFSSQLNSKYKKIDIMEYLLNKFGWMRNIKADGRIHNVSFNVITKNKLYNSNDILKHIYKVNLPTAKVLGTIDNGGYCNNNDIGCDVKEWRRIRYFFTNPEHITTEFMNYRYLGDMINMADSLGKKINPKWSQNRLKEEHDKWGEEITEILISFQPLKNLNIGTVFHEFQAFSGYEMLKTNHDLTREGKKMKHCVGTYSDNVNRGGSCIFHVHGCTLELRYGNSLYGTNKKLAEELGVDKILFIGQYQGIGNQSPNKEYYELVSNKVEGFNRTALYKGISDSFDIPLDNNGDRLEW